MWAAPEYDSVMDAYRCEICKEWFKGLGYHMKFHGMDMDEYKVMFGFNKLQSFLAKDVCRTKKEHALENGTYLNVIEGGKPFRFKNGKDNRRYYKRRPQTTQKLRILRRISVKVEPKKIRKPREHYEYKYIRKHDDYEGTI